MQITNSERVGLTEVYDLGLEKNHNFILSNGAIAHNCFNKSHSVAYSYLTYACAYLKAHYPLQFFTGLMTTRSKSLQPKDWAAKAGEYVNEAKELGILILPPAINHSNKEFSIKEDKIYFGFNAIRAIGQTGADAIVQARQAGPFKSIYDFVSRVDTRVVNTRVFQALALAGCFDRLGYSRKELFEKTDQFYSYIDDLNKYAERTNQNKEREAFNLSIEPLLERKAALQKRKTSKKNPLTEEELFFLEEHKSLRRKQILEAILPEWVEPTKHQRIKLDIVDLTRQAAYIGCYLGTHPSTLAFPEAVRLCDIEEPGKHVIAGTVLSVKAIKDKNGNDMAFLSVGDGTALAEGVIFSSIFKKCPKLLAGDLIRIEASVYETEEQIKFRVFSIKKYEEENGKMDT